MRKKCAYLFLTLLFWILFCFQAVSADVYSGWGWPVDNSNRALSRGYSSGHTGLDIAVASGTTVYASKAGTVLKVYTGCNNFSGNKGNCVNGTTCTPNCGVYSAVGRCNWGYGNGVVIRHPDGSMSAYGHMQNNIKVSEGQSVSQGTVLGYSGSSGNSTGPHLHFELGSSYTVKGTYIEPTSMNNNPKYASYRITSSSPTGLTKDANGYVYNVNGIEYVFSPLSDTTPPSITNVRVHDITQEGFYVSCVIQDDVGIENVFFHTWTVEDQSDIRTINLKDPTGAGNEYTVHVSFSDFGNKINTWYWSQIYAYDYSNNIGGITDASMSFYYENERPIVRDVKITDVDRTGYTVTCTATDNTGVEYVMFPTWTEPVDRWDDLQDRDDILWEKGQRVGNSDVWTYRVNVADHNGEIDCVYNTHVYAYDKSNNNGGMMADKVYIDGVAPVFTSVNVLMLDEESFNVSCNVIDNHPGVDRVQFAVWTDAAPAEGVSNQDDLIPDWQVNPLCSGSRAGDSFGYQVNIKDHNYERGLYHIHMYAYDKHGNVAVYTAQLYVPGEEANSSIRILDEKEYKNNVYRLYEVWAHRSGPSGEAELTNWEEAQAICQSLGGHLVTISSEEENQFVAGMVKNAGIQMVWTGLNDIQNTGKFTWESGEPLVYTNWGEGQQDRTIINDNVSENLGTLYADGVWNDIDAYARMQFICEFDATEILELALNDSLLTLHAFAPNGVVEKGFIYGQKGEMLTLDTPGRTYVLYTDTSENDEYILDITGMPECSIRGYMIYKDHTGYECEGYSKQIVINGRDFE